MRPYIRLFVGALVLGVLPGPAGASVAVASGATPSACASTQVTLSATADQPRNAAGTSVHITVALHNRSARSCTYVTGPFSPNYSLTNSAGATVWGSCWYGGGPAPCALYLLQKVLAPHATYRDRLTWDQRTGHPDLPVPAGRYAFRVSLSGLALTARTSVTIGDPAVRLVTVADSGRHLTVLIGQELEIYLPATGVYVWAQPRSSEPRVLGVVTGLHGPPGATVFAARARGTATLSATGSPTCYPQCLTPSRLFSIWVTVRAP